MTIRKSMVPLVEATRFRKKTSLADTGQPKVLVTMVILARSFMTPARKPRPSSGLTVLPDKKGKEKAIAPLPEEEKEKEAARKVRGQVQTDRVAAEEAKAAAAQEVRADLAEKAEKESVGVPRSAELIARAHTTILLQPMGEAPLHLANL